MNRLFAHLLKLTRHTRRLAGKRPPALLVVALAIGACSGDGDTIQIAPADLITIKVTDARGNPLAGVNTGFYKSAFRIDTPRTVPPTPYTTPGAFEEASIMQQTDGSGRTSFFLPRHGSVNSKQVIAANTSFGTLYSLVLEPEITVDLASTAFYEMIAYSTVPPSAFTVQQLLELRKKAYEVIARAIANYWINPSADSSKLLKAYRNALAADSAFVTQLINTAIAISPTYNLYSYVPYQVANSRPSLPNYSPSLGSPIVTEENSLDLSASGTDTDKDTLFYTWVLSSSAPTSTTLSQGTRLFGSIAGNATSLYHYTSDLATNTWYQATRIVYLTAVISDGGTPVLRTWAINVVNKERAPAFTSTGPTTGTEDALWTYTPTVSSPENAPMIINLPGGASPTPAGIDMCVQQGYYMASPPISGLSNLAVPTAGSLDSAPTYLWQVAGTPCTTPNLITWTPDNHQSGPTYSPQTISIVVTDYAGATATQTVSVSVTDVNTAPTITSTPANLNITPTFAAPPSVTSDPWTYNPTFTDPQSAVNDPGMLLPGGRNFNDVFTWTLTTSPAGATVDPVTGVVSWSPAGNQVGTNNFTLSLVDAHGGTTTQSWSVFINDVNAPPVIDVTQCVAIAHLQTPVAAGVNYTCDITVSQWTTGSLFQMAIANPPAGAILKPGAPGTFRDSNFTFGFDLLITDAVTRDADLGPIIWPGIVITITNDGKGGQFAPLSSSHTFTLSIPREDLPPVRVATDPTPATTVYTTCTAPDCVVNQTVHYTYTTRFTDDNSAPRNTPDTFAYAITQPVAPAPTHPMTISASTTTAPTGSVTLDWLVEQADAGQQFNFTLTTISGDNTKVTAGPSQDVLGIPITVFETNRHPIWGATPLAATSGQNGVLYSIDYGPLCTTNATTEPNNQLTFALSAGAPSGMVINPSSGLVTWTPTSAQAKTGAASYTILCESKLGSPLPGLASKTVNVALNFVNQPPVWVSLTDQILAVGTPISMSFQASDPDDDTVTLNYSGLPGTAIFTSTGGQGTLTWTPSITELGNYAANFTATDNGNAPGPLTANLPINFNVVNTPVILSHPVVRATAGFPYHYNIHSLDPQGGGLTFQVDVSQSPSGVIVTPIAGSNGTAAAVTWDPTLSFAGDQPITVNVIDAANNVVAHSWTISVGASWTQSPPLVNSVTPTVPVVLTEGVNQRFVATASDGDGDSLHYSLYWGNAAGTSYTWIADRAMGVGFPATFSYAPSAADSGDHTVKIAVNDGASADVEYLLSVHVRDALPSNNSSHTIARSTITGIIANSKNSRTYVMTGGADASVHAYDAANAITGGSSANFSLLSGNKERMVLYNNYAEANDFTIYFSTLGNITARGNTYVSYDSQTGPPMECGAGCFSPTFLAGTPSVGGSQTARYAATNYVYYIKSSDRRYIGTYLTNGTPQADIDLGAGASANALLLDSSHQKLFVSVSGLNTIKVINTATNAVSTITNSVGTNPSPMILSADSSKLYVYSPTDGTVTEVVTATNVANSPKSGFPTSALIGADPRSVFTGNMSDDIIYLSVPDSSEVVTFDVLYSGLHSYTMPSRLDEISLDTANSALMGATFSTGKVYRLK